MRYTIDREGAEKKKRDRVEIKWRKRKKGGKKGSQRGEIERRIDERGRGAHLYSLFSFFFIRARNVLCEQIESRWLPLNA